MTFKSDTRNSTNHSPMFKDKPSGKGKPRTSTGSTSAPGSVSTAPASYSVGAVSSEISTELDAALVLTAPAAPQAEKSPPVRENTGRPVVGRQLNDSRIPSLEDHVRIVQMMHAGERNLKKAAKDLAERLDVSRKEALAALQACS